LIGPMLSSVIQRERIHMNDNLRVLIVGGVACGPKTASRLKRLLPHAHITMIERGSVISYGACGLPYYVEGMFSDIEMLCQTPVGISRNAPFFEKVKGFEALTRVEALRINRLAKTVTVKYLDRGLEEDLPYDKLVLATGGRALKPPFAMEELENVWFMRHPDDAAGMVHKIEGDRLRKAVIIGAGYIGVEMAEALVRRGLEVSVVEARSQILPQFLDEDMALWAARHLKQKGVNLLLGENVVGLEGKSGRIAQVKTENTRLSADLVLISIGVCPNDHLARDAGLECSPRGGIFINSHCQTSDSEIYAGGDCVLNHHVDPIMRSPLYAPLGSTSNKHGRVIANHIAGISTPYSGITGTGICRAFDITIGRTGFTEKQARELDANVETAIWAGPDLPHYVPQSKPVIIKVVASGRSRKLLGVQVVGMGDVSKRLDIASTALFFGATVDEVGDLDLGYAPPYAPPIDPIAAAVHLMANKLDGLAAGISPVEAMGRMNRGDSLLLLDVRTPAEYAAMQLPHEVVHIPLGALRERMHELPRDRDILAFCKVSMRGYEAQRILNAAGFERVFFIEGGLVGWPYEVHVP